MTEVGYPLHQSAISKIEPPDPDQTTGRRRSTERKDRRSVGVREVIGLSKALDVPFGELLLPPQWGVSLAAWKDFLAASGVRTEIRNKQADYNNRVIRLRRAARQSEEFAARLTDLREEVMARVEVQVRSTWQSDNDVRALRGEPPAAEPTREVVASHRPPVVLAIDDVLAGIAEAGS